MSKPCRLRRGAGYGACADDAGFGEAPQQAFSRGLGPVKMASVSTLALLAVTRPRKQVHFQGTRFLCIYKALNSLKEKQRKVLLFDFWGAFSDKEIAKRIVFDKKSENLIKYSV